MAKLGEYADRLPKMTAQEVLDIVVTHLLTQNKKSKHAESAGCLYDGPNGLTCAAGPFVAKENVTEKQDWAALAHEKKVPQHHGLLIMELQRVHDTYLPEQWPHILEKVAKKRELQYTPPNID